MNVKIPISRQFKVMEPCLGIQGSELRFRGQWLAQAGFKPGDVVQLTILSVGRMELRLCEACEPSEEYRAAVGRLDKVLELASA